MSTKTNAPLYDMGGRRLAAGDEVVRAGVRRFGQFSVGRLERFTVSKVGRTKITLAGRASPILPHSVVALGPPEAGSPQYTDHFEAMYE